MITVKFPALQKALTKDTKDLNDDDPRRGIIVINGRAIVIQDAFCLVCNLDEYFRIEAGIEDEFEIQELERILFYMDGKVFSKEFWLELTKGANMKMNNGSLYLENPKYSKDLHQKDIDIPTDFIEPLSALANLQKQAVQVLSAIAIPYGALKTIYDCLTSDFKTDLIIFEFTGQDMPVKFTFRKRKHFYGYFHPHFDAAQEGFKFEDLETFTLGTAEFLAQLKEDAKGKVPPVPTEAKAGEEQKEVPDNQLTIVTDE